jgi:hypothetical protein
MKIKYKTGYAGTGKSTDLLKLLDTLPTETTIVLAPTHKALERLLKAYDGSIEFKTIHSLLGLIPSINEKAEHINHLYGLHKLDHPLEYYTNIVIDEAGMISEEHFMDLVGKIEEQEDYGQNTSVNVTLHVYMDPYQLLPVKGQQIIPDPATTVNLTTQYRSESKDIVALYTKFVDFMREGGDDLSTPYSENVLEFDINRFQKGDRLCAYTNQAVGQWNEDIAKLLHIKNHIGQEVQLGANMTVIADSYEKPKLNDLIYAYENGSLYLQNSKINKRFLEHALRALLHKDISFISARGLLIPVVKGIGVSALAHKKAGKDAIQDRSKFTHVYALGRAFTMDYNFASTVHKTQGDEFNHVFIDKVDIQKSIFRGFYGTYARLMYVGISRAKKRLYI